MAAELQMLTLAMVLDIVGVFTFKRFVNTLSPSTRHLIMAWTLLILAGLTEIIWLVALKNSNGFANTTAGVAAIAISWFSFFLLAYALKFIPAGTAYAVWTGCGAAGGALVGMWLLGEDRSLLRVGSIAFIIIGIIGIRVADNGGSTP